MSDTFWSDLVEEGVNGTATIGALTPDGSPERAKKAIDLSRESGIPAPVIDLNIDKIAEDVAQQKRLQDVKESEGLQLYIQNDPMAAKVSSDDFDPLKRIYEDLVKWAEEDPVLQAVGEAFGTDPLGLTPGGETEGFFRSIGLIKDPRRADPGALVTEPIIRGVAASFDLIGRSFASGAAAAGATTEVLFNDLNEALGGQPTGSPKAAGREMTNFVNFLLLRLGMERPFRAPPEKPTNKLEEYLKTAEELRPKPTRPKWHDVGEGGVNTELLRLEHQAIKTEYEAATLDAAVKAATESKTRERSPEMFETFVRPATGDRTIVISAEAARDIYLERGVAPGPGDAVLGWIPDIAQKIQLELARGGDIQVPLSGYLAHIDPEVHKDLLPSVRSPNGMSIKEVQAVQEEIEAALEGKEAAPAPTAADEFYYHGTDVGVAASIKAEGFRQGGFLHTEEEATTYYSGKDENSLLLRVRREEIKGDTKLDHIVTSENIPASKFEYFDFSRREWLPFDEVVPTTPSLGPIEAASTKARKALFLDPLFEEPKAAGMTDTEFKLYSEKVGRIFENDRLRDLKSLERIATRELTKEWKETLAEEIAKAETAFDARLDVRAEMFLTTGTLDPTVKVGSAIPLRASEVNKPNLKDMTSADGISPDDIAGLLGYTTGQEMLDALASLRDSRGRKQLDTYRREVTRAEAIPAAEARFGDFEARADAVAAGITDPDISKVLYDELRVMQKQGGGVPLSFEELLLRSQVYFNDYLTVTEASRTQSFVRKLIQAGRKAEMNLLKGKIPDAFKNKNEQLLAFFDMQQAVAFGKGLQKATRFIKKYTAKKPPGAVHPEYADQIQAILSSYGFPIRKPRFDLDQIPQLAEFLQEEIDLGFEIPMPEALLNGRIPKNWKEVTVAEFRDLMEGLQSLDHVGRDKLLGIKAGEQMELKALQDEIVASVERGALRFSRDPGVRENIEHARLSIDAYLTRMAEFFNDLDGGDPQGPLMQSVYRQMLEAQHREIDVYFKNAIEHIGKLPRVKNSKVQIKSPFMNTISERLFVFTKGDIVMLALNLGNKENRGLVTNTLLPLEDKAYETLAPYELDVIERSRAQQVIDFVNLHMTEDDWKFVTGLWEFFTNLKPEIDHLYRELTGVAPDTVEPLSINTPFGVMPGGYSRIMHDPVASDITAVREKALFDHGHAKAVTPNRYTKKRTGARKPFLVNGYYKMLPVEIRKMLHDLAFREALLNANKIFNKDVRLAIKKHYGPEYEGLISPWLRDIANHYNEDDARLRWLINLTKALRSNISTVALGLNPKLLLTPNISPLMMHPLDFQRYMQNIGANQKFVMENSVEVRDRMEMYDRDVGDFLRGQIGLAGPVERLRAAASRFGMYLAVKQDVILASARWWGEYHQALREGLTHEDAVFRGDLAVVREHGSQTVMNLPIVMRGNEFIKTTTMFLGFLNTAYNRQRTIVKLSRSGMKKVGGGDYAGAKRDFLMAAANTFAWVFTVSLLGLVYNPTAFDGEDGEDDWAGGAMELLLGNLIAEIPFVREIGSFLFQDISPRGSTIFTVGQQIWKSIEDMANFMADEDVSDRWLEHAINVPGYIVGMPTASPARAVQYLWNVTTNQDDMEDFGDFMNGILFGKSDPSKR